MWDDQDIHYQLLQQQEGQRMEAVVEEAFEVQSYQPFHGWVYERFCDRSGNTFPALSAAAEAVTAEKDRLNQLGEDVGGMEIGVLPSTEWMWSHPWIPDHEYTQCDEEGWSYGSTIARINRHLAEGYSKAKREYYHFVRRRRWIRTRVRKPSAKMLGTQEECHAISDADEVVSSTHEPSRRYYRMYRGSLFTHLRLGPNPNLSHFVKAHFTDDVVLREGWLGQRGSLSRSWKLRYFILRRDSSSLVCLRDRASLVMIHETLIDRHTSLMVEEAPNNDQQSQFLIMSGGRKLRLNAVNSTSRASWLSAISELIVRKRTSFLAAEDSETGSGTRASRGSRLLRRMGSRNSDDSHAWQIVTPRSRWMLYDTKSQRNLTEPVRKKVWRPYQLLSSTMQDKSAVDQQMRQEYLAWFQTEFSLAIVSAQAFLNDNIDVLEENLLKVEHILTAAVARVPEEDIERLRLETMVCIANVEKRLRDLLSSENANVLQCFMLRKFLYMEAKRVNDMILSFSPPVVQVTVKKVAPESPSKRRIPMDWFAEPGNVEKHGLSVDSSFDITRHSMPEQPVLMSSKSDSGVTASDIFNRKRHSTSVTGTSFLSTISAPAGPSNASKENLQMKSYNSLPAPVCDGHMELPEGVSGYVIPVHEKDLGSIIGFTLCSKAYVEAVQWHFDHAMDWRREIAAEEKELSEMNRQPVDLTSPTAKMYLDKLESADVQHTEVKLSYESKAVKHDFRCVSFFAAQFHALRALCGRKNAAFLCSIAKSNKWDTSGGKSGAFFSMTHDKRYILKGIPVTEFNMFLHMAPQYFRYMSRMVKSKNPTIITKILGIYKVTHSRKMHKQTTCVVVMENISYGFPSCQMYDIKGITRRRYDGPSHEDAEEEASTFTGSVTSDTSSRPVLLDGNLMERIPIPVRQSDLSEIERAIENDTKFLTFAGVVDYSLLMLFDEENRQVVVGLIDYLHQFDLLKKMESTSKSTLTFRNPTIINPMAYQQRFVNAMHRYLVGIELELELRIRKRAHTTAPSQNGGANQATNELETRGQASRSLPARLTRSASESNLNSQTSAIDRDATLAHSDGEDEGSEASDEACIRGADGVITSLLSGDYDR
ncbi:hypothetical protein Poli38472_006584 [Pythium oligandrum]|uniref:Uncharacterized protein n=1 Tax=Pythium oligandrum TaxID=41045 RepID=A0A8K1C4V0_PYTOL|nr:hypothetical protein Poli38472_006584 [Pythium oligandrum]|eukprot:TMW56574.1 hypothetical protein Poli38472_006584 [Pythium oligandrum]